MSENRSDFISSLPPNNLLDDQPSSDITSDEVHIAPFQQISQTEIVTPPVNNVLQQANCQESVIVSTVSPIETKISVHNYQSDNPNLSQDDPSMMRSSNNTAEMTNVDDRLAVSIGTIVSDETHVEGGGCELRYATAEEIADVTSTADGVMTSSSSDTVSATTVPSSRISPRKSSKKPAGRRSSGRISEIRRMKAEKMAEMRRAAEMESIVDNREGKDRKQTGLAYDSRMLLHACPWDHHHIECPERLSSIWSRCSELGLVDKCLHIPSREATDDEVQLYHTEHFVSVLEASKTASAEESRQVCTKYDSVYLCPETATAARLATGAAIDLVEAVLNGQVHNGIGLIRPPGHHAMEDELNGFCGFNNAVIAAKTALNKGLKKICIIDIDLHHGQGVQRAFYKDSRVLYMSVHRWEQGRYWPHLRESNFDFIGAGSGTGFNVNVPLNVTGCGASEYLAVFQRVFLPIATEYNPDLVIVCAGYDAAIGCPEGCMKVTPAAYSHMISSIAGLTGGRLVVLLEGGYCLQSLAQSAALTLRTMIGETTGSLPPTESVLPSVLKSILGVTTALRSYWKCMQIRPLLTKLPPDADPTLRSLYPNLEFNPPADWPPENFPTSDYYLVFDDETKEKLATEIARINLNTRLRETEYTVCIAYDDLMCRHSDDNPHPEAPERIVRIYERIKDGGFLNHDNVVQLAKGRKLTLEEALLVHSKDHWDNMVRTVNMNMEDRDEMAEGYNSIYLNEFSFECGLLSGGAVLSTVDRVMADCRSGIAIVRPPGHHAEQDEAHGFCVFNNVAVAAQYAISVHGLSRVLILDWDVHHGNGIQHMFYNTNQVLYISLHRYDNGFFFPCSEDADADKVGEGAGKGFNVNIPWNSRKCGDLEYYLAFMNIVMPIAYEYCPELILVSAGFDAARGDPLGGFRVTPGMYGLMTHHLTSLAEGRVVVALEGGYNLTSISESMYMCARALRGDPLPQVNLDSPLRDEVVDTIQQVLDIQQIYWKSLHNTTLPIPENVNLLSEIALPSSSSVDVDDLCTELENSISIPLSTTRHKLLENSVQYS